MAASIHTTHFSPSANTFDSIMDSTTTTTIQPQYLKMEDLQTGSSPTPTAYDHSTTPSQTSPAPVIVHSKPAKKRKSWGQELPEPKTTLPPRKRAKTDDEKEQRRIERIKRNRAAAHNSRERKRQETDTLAVLLARANAELDAYRKLHGPLPASVILPEVTLSTEEEPTPAPSLSASCGSVDPAASPASPADTVMSSHPTIKQEPFDLTSIDAPAFDMLAPKSSLPQLDVTQHSAAMLCDLQCPSSLRASKTSSLTSLFSTFQASWWTAIITSLITLQIRTCYQQILTALWTISPSKMGRLIQASTTRMATIRSRSTTSSTTNPSLSRSTRPLAQLNAATGLVSRRGAHAALARQSSLTMRRTMNGSASTTRGSGGSTGSLRKGPQDSEKHSQGGDDGVRRSGAD